MADIQQTIGNILSDPDAMNRIRELGKSLGLSGEGGDAQPQSYSAPSAHSAPVQTPVQNSPSFDLSALSSLLSGAGTNNNNALGNFAGTTGGLNADTISSLTKFLPLLSSMNQEDDATALLYALRPFLSDTKRKRLDDAGRMLRIMRVLPMIRGAGLF